MNLGKTVPAFSDAIHAHPISVKYLRSLLFSLDALERCPCETHRHALVTIIKQYNDVVKRNNELERAFLEEFDRRAEAAFLAIGSKTSKKQRGR